MSNNKNNEETKTQEVKAQAQTQIQVATPTEIVKPEIARLDSMLEYYKNIALGNIVGYRGVICKEFSRVVDYVLSTKDNEVYTHFFKFFIDNRNGVCSADVALKGIRKLSDGYSINKVSGVWTVLDAIVTTRTERGAKFRLDRAAIAKFVDSETFSVWVMNLVNG